MSKTAKQKLIILFLAAAYFLCLSYFAILNYQGFKTQMNDLGNADQAIWQASLGHLSMPVSNDVFTNSTSRFYRHANFIFWLIAPLYRIWPNPEILLVITSLACALAGLGLFAIARHRLNKSWWSLAPPIVYWLSPMVQDANLFDFHVVTIMSALFVWMIWAFDTGKNKTGWVLLFLALLCQEDVGLMLLMYGLYLIISGKNKLAIPIILIGILYPIILFKLFIPLLNHGSGIYAYGGQDRYKWLIKDVKETLSLGITHAGAIFIHLARPDRLRVPLYFLISGALAGIRSWPILLLLLPTMLEGMLTSYSIPFETRITGTYYWICPETFIILSCIFSSEHYFKDPPARVPLPLTYLCVITLILSFLLTPLPYGVFSDWNNYELPKERGTLDEMIRLIPSSAPVSVQNDLGSHLSHRNMIAVYPRHLKQAEYALFFVHDVSGTETNLTAKTCDFLCDPYPVEVITRMINWRDWGLITHKDGFYLFGRGYPRPDPQEVMKAIDADAQTFNRARKKGARFYRWAWGLNFQLTWDQIFKKTPLSTQ
jgi:uncharacterized membrane protein